MTPPLIEREPLTLYRSECLTRWGGGVLPPADVAPCQLHRNCALRADADPLPWVVRGLIDANRDRGVSGSDLIKCPEEATDNTNKRTHDVHTESTDTGR